HTDVRRVAFAAVDDRVEEHVVAGDGGEEEELPVVGQGDLFEGVLVACGGHELWEPGDRERVVVGAGGVLQHVQRDGHPDDRGGRVVHGTRFVVRRVEADGHPHRAVRGGAECVDDLVLQLDGAGLAPGVGGEVHLARRVEDTGPARHLHVAQYERVAVGVGVVVEHIERGGRSTAHLGDVGLRDRRTVRRVVAHGIDGHRGVGGCSPAVADRVGEVDAAREPGRWHDLDRFLIRRDVDGHTVGHAGEGGDHQRIAVGVLVVGDEVYDYRLIGTRPGAVVAGHGRFVDPVLVYLRIADLAD